MDLCPNTPLSEVANNNGCSESQIDSDLDGVFNSLDQCPNTTLLDLNGDGVVSEEEINKARQILQKAMNKDKDKKQIQAANFFKQNV